MNTLPQISEAEFDITAMVSAYIENDKLSESELDTLRTLLSQK